MSTTPTADAAEASATDPAAGPAQRRLGRGLFAAGLLLWALLSLRQLPYGCQNLHYFVILEQQFWMLVELVHPLFVPLLAAFRFLLRESGYQGNLVVPFQAAGLLVSAGTLAALFLLGERLFRDSVSAAVAVLLLGTSAGFWEGALKPDPYALAAGCLAAAFFLLLPGPRPARPVKFALAGAAAGAAAGLHTAAIALAPAAALAAWLEAGRTRRAARLLGLFLLGLTAALSACYGIFWLYHGLDASRGGGFTLRGLFAAVQQMPRTSVYDNPELFGQLGGFLLTLLQSGLAPLLLWTAAALAGLRLSRAAGARLDAPRAGALALAGACFASFSLFFILNNNANSFAYSSALFLPLVVTAAMSRGGRLRRFALPAAAAALALQFGYGHPLGALRDPVSREASFLAGLLRPGDLLLLPGEPFPETAYLHPVEMLQLGDLDAPLALSAKSAKTPPEAARRLISGALRAGRAAYFSAGDLRAPGFIPDDRGGSQKQRQLFFLRGEGTRAAFEGVERVRRDLAAAFTMDCGVVSPQGRRYCRLGLKAPAARQR